MSYFYLLYQNHKALISLNLLLVVAFFVRVILMFSFPNLSNDIYRFFWDGLLMHDGIHPLSYLPSELIDSSQLEGKGAHMTELYALMNSPEYFTIYPPISQLIFYISTIIPSFSLTQSTLLMKIILWLSEIGTLVFIYKMLSHLEMNKNNILLYALNPLVIIEIMGNVHYEGVMAFFLIAGIYYLMKNKAITAGILIAASVATKLLPLMFMPILLVYLYKKGRGLSYFFISFTITCLLFFLPFFIGLDLAHFLDSIDLYFRKFEFNAGIYYALRYIGKILTGYNQIIILGPVLSLTALYFIVKIAKKHYDNINVKEIAGRDLMYALFCSFVIYLLCTTTVHPWYLIVPLALNVFVKRIWILVWSFMIILSYSTYLSVDFTQNLFLISIEYIVVLVVWYLEKKSSIKFA